MPNISESPERADSRSKDTTRKAKITMRILKTIFKTVLSIMAMLYLVRKHPAGRDRRLRGGLRPALLVHLFLHPGRRAFAVKRAPENRGFPGLFLCCGAHFFKKLRNATAMMPQSTMVARMRTTSAPPEIAMRSPPHSQPRQAQSTSSTASKPRMQPTALTEPLMVGRSWT